MLLLYMYDAPFFSMKLYFPEINLWKIHLRIVL